MKAYLRFLPDEGTRGVWEVGWYKSILGRKKHVRVKSFAVYTEGYNQSMEKANAWFDEHKLIDHRGLAKYA